MSAIRQHRMRELAVNKLALAYRIDEIATAVVTMQSASAVDEVAAKVLKKNADQLEALYVNFFHEKIPSRCASVAPPPQHLLLSFYKRIDPSWPMLDL